VVVERKNVPPGGGCGSGYSGSATTRRNLSGQTDVPFARRTVDLDAIPTTGTRITNIDLDLTVECNLRCVYCFKEKWNEHMEDSVAFDAIVWLLHASGSQKRVGVNFMGGEPLHRFRLIKKLVPFAKRRAAQMGKSIHFGMTTNGTLVTPEVIAFWEKWGLGFHTSIDGTPEIQDRNRPTVGNKGSSRLVEKAVPKILGVRPGTMARSTVTPETAGSLVESYHYFRKLDYTAIGFVPGGPSTWNQESIELFNNQFQQLADIYMDECRRGILIQLKGIDEAVEGVIRGERYSHTCGAGRGLLLIDIHGDIWPCHRWNKERFGSWKIGSIYTEFNDLARKELDVSSQADLLMQNCAICDANRFCSGGCPAENLEETGFVYKRHDNACKLTRVMARAGQRVHDTLVAEKNDVFMRKYYPDLIESDCPAA
jgi:uncharacterized protein